MVGYDVSVTVTMRSSPRPHELEVLADQFEAVEHDPGSTTVKIIEHVAVSDEADAVAFVRLLVAERLPGAPATAKVSPLHPGIDGAHCLALDGWKGLLRTETIQIAIASDVDRSVSCVSIPR